MDGVEVTAIRELSRIVFGQDYRLELMLAIRTLQEEVVTLGELAIALRVPVSSLQKPFHSLVRAGLLTPLPSDDSRRKFYGVAKSSAWDWAEELAQRVEFDAVVRGQNNNTP
ncbi:hypothetical protein [Microbacterium sp.]|uniref:hypothetical protein n=1 Tax=Microbacterium sp. TaxID=51671 RepID=UPI0032218060